MGKTRKAEDTNVPEEVWARAAKVAVRFSSFFWKTIKLQLKQQGKNQFYRRKVTLLVKQLKQRCLRDSEFRRLIESFLGPQQPAACTSQLIESHAPVLESEPNASDVEGGIPSHAPVLESEPNASDVECGIPSHAPVLESEPNASDVEGGIPSHAPVLDSESNASDVECGIPSHAPVLESEPNASDVEGGIPSHAPVLDSESNASDVEGGIPSHAPVTGSRCNEANDCTSPPPTVTDSDTGCPKVPFTLSLDHAITSKMFNGHDLRKGWTDALYGAIRHSSNGPKCVLVTRYRHMKKRHSKKARTPFFRCHAKCTLPGCHTFQIEIQAEPVNGKATVTVNKYGEENACHSAYHSHRYLRGKRRVDIGDRVRKDGAYAVRHSMIDETPEDQLADGNLTEAPPSHVLRQAAYESRKAQRYSSDWAEDLAITMDMSKVEDTHSKKLFGGVHFIGKCPLLVMVYREYFLRKYSATPSTVHIDATGSVTRQMGSKTPYLYAVIAEHQNGSYPLAQLLSESHTVPAIQHFLLQVARDMREVTGKVWRPPRVVTDFSWALLHAVSEGLCKRTLKAYLQECWDHQGGDRDGPSMSKLSLCGAHLSHRFATVLKNQKVDRKASAVFMWLYAKMQQASSLAQLDTLFEQFCVLACSEGEVRQLAPPLQYETSVTDHGADEALPEPDQTFRTGTEYGRHFELIKTQAPLEVATNGHVTNKYYHPSVVEYMLSTLMPLVPLWSQVVTSAVTSNAAVESYMRILKKQILHGRTRLHPGDFVRTLLKDTASRIKSDVIPQKLAPRGKKKRKEAPLTNPESQKEMWKKRDPAKKPTWYARMCPPSEVLQAQCERESNDLIDIVFDGTEPSEKTTEDMSQKKVKETASGDAVINSQDACASDWDGIISAGDATLRCLAPRTWLSDEVIDSFCLSVSSQSRGNVVSFSTHWLTAMCCGRTIEILKHCLHKRNAHNAKIWLLPYHRNGDHWALLIVSFQHQVVIHLDGLYGSAEEETVQHVQRLVDAAQRLQPGACTASERSGSWSRWRLVNPACLPRQEDSYSCGTRVCFYAEIVATGVLKMAFRDEDMRAAIRHMIHLAQSCRQRSVTLGFDGDGGKSHCFVPPRLTVETDVGPHINQYLTTLHSSCV